MLVFQNGCANLFFEQKKCVSVNVAIQSLVLSALNFSTYGRRKVLSCGFLLHFPLSN